MYRQTCSVKLVSHKHGVRSIGECCVSGSEVVFLPSGTLSLCVDPSLSLELPLHMWALLPSSAVKVIFLALFSNSPVLPMGWVLFFVFIDLKKPKRERETETEWLTSQMATKARSWPAQSWEPEASCNSTLWEALKPSPATFPRSLARSWIVSKAVGDSN